MAAQKDALYFMGTDGMPFTINTYRAATAAAGTYIGLDQNQIAASTSPQDTFIPKDCYLVDYVAVTDTAGVVELVSNGRKTGIFMTVASHTASNAGRPPLRVPLKAGTQLRMQVAVTFAA